MSRIDDLIAELCPSGVEFEAVGALIECGSNIKWLDHKGEGFRYIDLGSVDRVTHVISSTETITSDSAPSRAQQVVREGDILFGTTRPMLKRYCVVPAEFDGQIASTGYCVLRPDPDLLLSNYLFHLFGTAGFYAFVETNQRGASYPAISDRAIREFRVPLPPLEVQREIVRVLDQFAQLEAELEAELEARRRQYAHYQSSLLSFSKGEARWMTLGDIGKVSMCKRVFKDETSTDGDIPFFKIGTFGGTPNAYISRELYESYRARYGFPRRGDVLISAAGTIGRAVSYDGEPAYFQDSNIVWIDNDESVVTNAYLKFWYRVIEWSTDGGTIRRLYNENIRRAKIAVPSLAAQEHIVEALSKFDALVNDLSVGLPAELAARRKQYEYYRDRLLTFEEIAA